MVIAKPIGFDQKVKSHPLTLFYIINTRIKTTIYNLHFKLYLYTLIVSTNIFSQLSSVNVYTLKSGLT